VALSLPRAGLRLGSNTKKAKGRRPTGTSLPEPWSNPTIHATSISNSCAETLKTSNALIRSGKGGQGNKARGRFSTEHRVVARRASRPGRKAGAGGWKRAQSLGDGAPWLNSYAHRSLPKEVQGTIALDTSSGPLAKEAEPTRAAPAVDIAERLEAEFRFPDEAREQRPPPIRSHCRVPSDAIGEMKKDERQG
jgi:hypothetical protein